MIGALVEAAMEEEEVEEVEEVGAAAAAGVTAVDGGVKTLEEEEVEAEAGR